jgi:hypothetical protein
VNKKGGEVPGQWCFLVNCPLKIDDCKRFETGRMIREEVTDKSWRQEVMDDGNYQ